VRAGWAAEKKVHEALARALPDDWVAWHGLRFRAGRRDGEADFVIADPAMGFLVVEVKAGRVTQSGGRWYYEGGRPMDPAPLDQAQRAARGLSTLLDEAAGRRLEVPFSVAVWFPDTEADAPPSNADLRDAVLLARDLADPVPALRRAFAARITPGNAPPDPGWIDTLTELWGRDYDPRQDPLRCLSHLAALRETMNDAQLAVLRGLAENRRVLVEGRAGTGKTSVARLYAEERAWAGDRVLFLCFTDPLARWLDRAFEDLRRQGLCVRASTLRRLAHAIVAGPGEPPPVDHDGWMDLVARAAGRARPEDAVADVVFVDELQCFDAPDMALLGRLVEPSQRLWAFWDPKQAFWARPPLPAWFTSGLTRFTLPVQRRALASLAALARAYGEEATSDAPARQAERAGTLCVHVDERPVGDAVADVLAELEARGIDRRNVAVLSLVGRGSSALVGRPSIGPVPAVPADEAPGPDHVVLDTFLRFEGLERPVIVVCEGAHPAARRNYAQRMYMALTRASARVEVVAPASLAQRDPILGPLLAVDGGLRSSS